MAASNPKSTKSLTGIPHEKNLATKDCGLKPNWHNEYLPVPDVEIEIQFDDDSQTIYLTPTAGLLSLDPPAPRMVKGKLYTCVATAPDTRVPLRYKYLYTHRNEEHPLDLLLRSFLPMLWLNYKSMNTFLPVHGVIDREGNNEVEKCIPSLRAIAEYAVSREQLFSSNKNKRPYGVTPSNFVEWLVESRYQFAADTWIRPFLKIWLADIEQSELDASRQSRGPGRLPWLRQDERVKYESICEGWATFRVKQGTKARKKNFCKIFQLPNGQMVTPSEVKRALDWKDKDSKRSQKGAAE